MDNEYLSKLIARIYEAALDDDCWPDVLRSVETHFHCAASALHILDPDQAYILETNLNPDAVAAYHDRYWVDDVWVASARPRPAGTVMTGASICAPQDLPPDFYNACLVASGTSDAMTLKTRKTDTWEAYFTVHRGTGQDHFSADDVRAMEMFRPHLMQAVEIREQLACRLHQVWALDQALYRLATPVFLVDDTMRITWFNPKADELMRANAHRPPELRRNRFLLGTHRNEVELQEAVHQAVRGTTATRVVIQRAHHRLPLIAHVLPVSNRMIEERIQSWAPSKGRRLCLILVRDPAARMPAPASLLQQYFGLSKHEAALARLIGMGMALDDLGDELQMSRRELRGHLQHLLDKVDMRSEHELIRVLSRLDDH